MPKETYSYAKRDLFAWQPRPIQMPNEPYSDGTRDLFSGQKRPIQMPKEGYCKPHMKHTFLLAMAS